MRMTKLNTGILIATLMTISGAQQALAHHETDSLPLYPRDAADQCVDDGLQIRVTVEGAQHKGLVKVELYSPDDKFLKDETRKVRVPASDEPFRVCMNIDAPGTYAVAGYNDLDADRKIDKKLFKPDEPFGVVNSDKVEGKKRPKFHQVSFEVGEKGADVKLILIDGDKE